MGMNYYHRTNICKECGRYDNRHIGKSSFGWTFSFQGYDGNMPDDGTVIESYKDWLYVLKREGKIYNEENKEISLDAFKKKVKSKKKEKNNHTVYCKKRYPEERCWLDEEGHSFSLGDFS